jgi:putative membrane protein
MMGFILQAFMAAAGFWVSSKILPGVHVDSVSSLIAAGLILGIINAVVRPILVLLTLPLTLVTLGLFLLVVNGITVWLVTKFLHGVQIDSFGQAILTAVIICVTSWIASAVFDPRKGKRSI